MGGLKRGGRCYFIPFVEDIGDYPGLSVIVGCWATFLGYTGSDGGLTADRNAPYASVRLLDCPEVFRFPREWILADQGGSPTIGWTGDIGERRLGIARRVVKTLAALLSKGDPKAKLSPIWMPR